MCTNTGPAFPAVGDSFALGGGSDDDLQFSRSSGGIGFAGGARRGRSPTPDTLKYVLGLD